MLVADAALAVELSLDRLGEQADSALGGEELVAPCLLWSEVPSVLSEMAFRGEISRDLATQALERFLTGEIHVAERRHVELTMTAWRIASELGWAKTYDAEYLAMRGFSILASSRSTCACAAAPTGSGSWSRHPS